MTSQARLEHMEKAIRPGLAVRVVELNPRLPAAIFVRPETLARRRRGVTGIVYSWLSGHGGDVWWVIHDGTGTHANPKGELCWDESGIAPYGLDELEER